VRIERKDQERVIFVNANYSGGTRLGDRRHPQGAGFGDGARTSAWRSAATGRSSRRLSGTAGGFALAIFLSTWSWPAVRVMARPFIVLFSIRCADRITVTMLATKTVFSIQAFIGCIMLAGSSSTTRSCWSTTPIC